MTDFIIQGGMVVFTLQEATRSDGGQRKPAEPETVAQVIMREHDFAQRVAFPNQHVAALEERAGRKLGEPEAGGTSAPGGGMKIRPKSG